MKFSRFGRRSGVGGTGAVFSFDRIDNLTYNILNKRAES